MSAHSDKTLDIGKVELAASAGTPDDGGRDTQRPDALFRSHARTAHHSYNASPFLYQAVVYATRDRLMERWGKTRMAIERDDNRRVSYLSLEFLMGRLLRNALLNLGIEEETAEALNRIGLDLEDVYDREHDAGLGNGGLGRLAACFLDSCATLSLPVVGYGIRYQYGMFRQRLENGHQIEEPDSVVTRGVSVGS